MKLKELRTTSEKSQLDIANYLNISQSNYSKYELGVIEPSIETLVKIADYFNVTLDYLVGRNFATTFALDGLKPEQKEAVKLLLSLNNLNFIKAVSYMGGLYANQ